MKGLPIWITLTLLQYYETVNGAEIARQYENDKITYVQIKPISDTNAPIVSHKNSELFRSSRIENIPLQIRGSPVNLYTTKKPSEIKLPIPEIIRTPRSEDAVKIKPLEQSTEVLSAFTDYIDQGNESEVRFDTSEAISPNPGDTVVFNENANEKIAENDNNKISTSHANDLYKYYPKGKSDKIKLKSLATKKFYGNLETVNPTYRKYLETRRYRSRCRCERIWNCPKIQISIPRCPEEYFFCCF